jgi:hypothetical protein
MPVGLQKFRGSFQVRDLDLYFLGGSRSGFGNIYLEESIRVSRFGLAEVVIRGDFQNALERTVVDFHNQEFAPGATATIWTLALDEQKISLNRDLEILSTHSSQFNTNNQVCIHDEHVGVRYPMSLARRPASHIRGRQVKRRVDFAHGNFTSGKLSEAVT